MKFSLLAAAAVLIAGASAHMEQLESGLIDYYWLKGSDGSTVIHITSPEQFKSIHPIPENGLFSVPKNS
ncbi:hypothetical protein G6F70_002763 [Rhizopus microsporus]|uniref:Uncharacterized protein n=1 Tax=Rhizopus azygosporus TaxID=86630 RepID=A0A367IT16_RHIAZ|nr:hypothetical protein G6F71_002724 [Rhizopus microsporus]RCH80840.1 hypothetical protein CU097_005304 [Rhizopus azygosporus]KAG1201855.1 hypothetical protein G6F70_002763 [Rhizopus microsporus]KAG1213804.1 hypothetical protein G6F69_002514 [Rhizopus microsporus]KAG1236095.1 hypothetical protein G6F67_002273 [Rhizopus microsporus]